MSTLLHHPAKNGPPGKPSGRKSVIAVLALGFRIQQRGTYTFNDAQLEFGISLRTYNRYLATLRASGMIIVAPSPSERLGNGYGHVRYLGYDHMFYDRDTKVAS